MNNTFHSKRWLVVDDDPIVLKFTVMALQALPDIEIAAFANPRLALETFIADPDSFEILVTDFDMPGINGLELARCVRARSPKLHVLLISGSGLDEADVLSEGLDGFLPKPCLPDDLIHAIQAVLKDDSHTAADMNAAIVHE